MSDSGQSTRVSFQPEVSASGAGVDQKSAEQKLVDQMAEGNDPDVADSATGGSEPSDETVVERVIAALKTVYDPEIPVNIYDLGLIYRVESNQRMVEVDMTLTAPGCPVAQTFPGMVEGTVKLVPGVTDAIVELVWDPPWRQEMISEEARLELGLL